MRRRATPLVHSSPPTSSTSASGQAVNTTSDPVASRDAASTSTRPSTYADASVSWRLTDALFVRHAGWLLLAVAAVHVVVCPFSKVEESFAMQATHDLLTYGTAATDAYDHHRFPGVVARSFAGPLLLSAGSWPLMQLLRRLPQLPRAAVQLCTQLTVRLCLAAAVAAAFGRLVRAVASTVDRSTAVWLTLIGVSQFHWVFYAGRTLANTMATPFVLLAFEAWLYCIAGSWASGGHSTKAAAEAGGWHRQLLVSCGVAVLVMRCELMGLLGPVVLFELLSRRLSVVRLLTIGLPTATLMIVACVSLDSWLWRRWVWPELDVFWFNVVHNGSHAWGVSPPLWYLYSALPRALAASLPLAVLGLVVDRRARQMALPAVLYVAAYSALPHKELRFILYTVPLFNLAAACGCRWLCEWGLEATVNSGRFERWSVRLSRHLAVLGVIAHLALNAAFTCLLLTVSRQNYPGGHALYALQMREPLPSSFSATAASGALPSVRVHIDVYTAQTGVTRFVQWRTDWSFNKTESLAPHSPEMRGFDYLLVGGCGKSELARRPYFASYRLVDTVEAFDRLTVDYTRWPPLRIRLKPAIFVLENRRRSSQEF